MKNIPRGLSKQPVFRLALCALVIAILPACGGGGGGSAAGGNSDSTLASSDTTVSGDAGYFPMAIGDRWVYRTWTDSNTEASQLALVKVTEALNLAGRDAKVLRTYSAIDGVEYDAQYLTVSENALTALADPMAPSGSFHIPTVDVVRFGSSSFQQLDQVFDSGADADGDGRHETWRIKVQVDNIGVEKVQTDAGVFSNCLHIKSSVTQTAIYTTGAPSYVVATTVHSWYAAGVGLVKEDVETQLPDKPASVTHQTLAKYNVAGVRSESLAPKATLLKPNGVAPFSAVEIAFDEYVDVSSITSVAMQLRDAKGKSYPLTVNRGASSFSFYPAAGPLPSGTYTATVGGVGTDLVGNAVASSNWTFDVDTTAPEVVSMTPAEGAKYVPVDQIITLTFSEDLDPASVPGNISLNGPDGQIASAIETNGKQVTLKPYAPLAKRKTYSVAVSYDLRDKFNNRYGKAVYRSFQTDPGMFDEAASPNGSMTPSSPSAVAIGDVNGDGLNDVVMTNWFYFNDEVDYKLFVYHQQANGKLAAPITLPTQQTYSCGADSIAVGDLNGDGKADVVQANSGCGLEIFYQSDKGELKSSGVLSSNESYLVKVADVNKDGRADIIGIGWGTEKVSVWLQQPDGTIGQAKIYSLKHYGWESLEVGDLNGDGRLDIVVSSGQGEAGKSVGILYQLADGSFGNSSYIGGGTVNSVAIGDLNGDGRNDLVIARSFYGGLSVVLQDASGNLGPVTDYLKSESIEAVTTADVNLDGRRDLVVTTAGLHIIYIQKPDGTLERQEEFPSSIGYNLRPQSLTIGDINNDGKPDLVGKGLVYLLNRSPSSIATPSSLSKAQSMKGGSSSQSKPVQGRAKFLTSLPKLNISTRLTNL